MADDLALLDPAVEAVVRAIAPVLVRLRSEQRQRLEAFEAALADRIANSTEQTEALLEEGRRRAEDAIRQSAEAVRSLAGLVTQETRAMPDRLLQQVALLPRPRDGRDGRLTIAHAHVSGRVYDPGEIARHRGGTWQAIDRTAEEPGPEATTWRIIADGVCGIDGTQDSADPRAWIFGLDRSDGLRHELRARFPIPLHRRAYQGNASYEMGDEVALDGNSWRCVVDRATTSPPSEEWALVSQRGGRGKQGERGPAGDRGEPGPIGREGAPGRQGERGERGISITGAVLLEPGVIALQFDNETLSGPISLGSMRFVGVFKPGDTYQPGDIARLGYNLFIAHRETGDVPSATDGNAWALFLPGVEPSGGAGGGAGGVPVELDPFAVHRTGGVPNGVMTGFLTLNDDPIEDLHAVPKRYVDALFTGVAQLIGVINGATGDVFYSAASGFPFGPLVPAAIAGNGAYVICAIAGTVPSGPIAGAVLSIGDWVISDGAIWIVLNVAQTSSLVPIGPAPPANPLPGQLWWRDDPDGDLYIRYNDGASVQWVPASRPSGGASPLVPIGPMPPANAQAGQLWWRDDPDADLYIRYDDGASVQWVPASRPSGGASPLVPIGPTPPANAQAGQLWWRDDPDGDLYIRYDDGASAQWVPASRPSDGGGGPPIDLTGFATEQYVDAAIAAIPPVNLAGYATEQYVDTAIAAIPPIDLAPYIDRAGDMMTGDLQLPAGVPPTGQSAVNREWVESLASGGLYQGAWTIGTNNPDLTAIIRGTERGPARRFIPHHGARFLCLTTDPDTIPAEMPPVAIPGLTGRLITTGSHIIWDAPLQQWDLVTFTVGSLTQDLADQRYLRLIGGTLTGMLTLPTTVPTANQATTKTYVDQQRDTRVAKSGDTMTGPLTMVNASINMPASGTGVLRWPASGTNGPPTFNTRSAGTKIVVWGDGPSATSAEYAIGMMSNSLWYGVGTAASYHRFYGGTTELANLTNGAFNMNQPTYIRQAANGIGLRLLKTTSGDVTSAPSLGWADSGNVLLANFIARQVAPNSYYASRPAEFECWVSTGAPGFGFGMQKAWNTSYQAGGYNAFRVQGDVFARGVQLTSDASLKSKIGPISSDAVDAAFDAISPIQFHWLPVKIANELAAPEPWVRGVDDDPESINWGFLADDIEAAMPHLVQQKDGVRSFDLTALVAILWAKVKQLEANRGVH